MSTAYSHLLKDQRFKYFIYYWRRENDIVVLIDDDGREFRIGVLDAQTIERQKNVNAKLPPAI